MLEKLATDCILTYQYHSCIRDCDMQMKPAGWGG